MTYGSQALTAFRRIAHESNLLTEEPCGVATHYKAERGLRKVMKLNFKRIASVITGTVMLSSTLAFAAAANYPTPFVKNTGADVAVVYGSQPGAELDLVAVADVTTNLQAALARQTASSGSGSSSSSVSGGDYVKLAKASDNVNLGNTVSGVFGSTLSDDDLENLLADGTYRNDENTEFDYEQTITLGSGLQLNAFADSDYNDEEPTIGLNLSDGQTVLTYTLDFTTDAESDVSNGDLVDLETTDISLLGKSYYILDADNSTLTLTLLDAANTETVKEGESKTVSVGDKNYEISISTINTDEVKLIVDGESTNSLNEGETYKLKDGTYIGIKDIFARDVAGVAGQVEFSIGSGKLEIVNGQDVDLNDDSIEGLNATITTGTSGTKRTIDKISLTWATDDDEFVTSSQSLTMPGFEALKLSMGNFVTPAMETTEVEDGSDDYLVLTTTIKDGDVTIPLLYANASGDFTGVGQSSTKRLATSVNQNILFNEGTDDWMVASWNSSSESESYLLSFDFNVDNGINRTTINKREDGSTKEVCKDKTVSNTCTLGSLTLTVTDITKSGGDYILNLTAGNGGSFNTLYTAEGLKVALPYEAARSDLSDGAANFTTVINGTSTGHNADSFWLFFTEENEDDDVAQGTKFNMTLSGQSDGDVEVSDTDTGRESFDDPANNDNSVSTVRSDLASEVWFMGDSSSQRTAKIIYHGSESFADVFLTASGATVESDNSTVTSGGSTTVKELGSVIVKDNEVASVAGKNLIVVGGSCVNTLAAQLLGGAGCGQSFEQKTGVGAGSFLIETFSRSEGKVATLVAGYNAQDTVNAAKYLTTQSVDTMAGKKYIGTSATSAQLQVASGSSSSSNMTDSTQ
jgi:hypothetical protein